MAVGAWRSPVFFAVAACFFVQTALVWLDLGARPGSTVPIAPSARQGQTIFRSHGCQSCHAVFGMGGFLGPDLTNAARRVPPARFAELLQFGSGAMPAYHLDQNERDAVSAYLAAIDSTGQGTPPAPLPDAGPLFSAGLARWSKHGEVLPERVAEGARIVASGTCAACHRSFSVDSAIRAPDLSLATSHLEQHQLHQILAQGRGAMPASGLDAQQMDAVISFLDFLAAHRDVIAPGQPTGLASLPWFEYPRQPTAQASAAAVTP